MRLNLPNIRRIARSGTVFKEAFVPSPLCAPSRACLAAGRNYDSSGVPNNFQNDYPINQTTFFSKLRDTGYWTMTVGKDDLTKASQLGTRNHQGDWRGLFHQHELGFSDGLRSAGKMDVVDTKEPHDMYGHFLKEHSVTVNDTNLSAWNAHYTCMKHLDQCNYANMFPDSLYEDNWVAENALTLLRRRDQDRPYFMMVNFPGPHPPFLVTSNMTKLNLNQTYPKAIDNENSTSETCYVNGEPQDDDRCSYAAELLNLDQLFGKILNQVNEEKTIVCYASDHGEMLSDHGDVGKTMPWSGSVSVPLACSGPGIAKGKVVTRPVSTMDLAATFLDFGRAEKPEGMSSVSLRPLMSSSNENNDYDRPYISSGLDNWRMVVESETNLKFVCCKGKCPGVPKNAPDVDQNGWQQVLYNVSSDPYDMNPLTVDGDVMSRLRRQLPRSFGCGSPSSYHSTIH